MVELGYKFLVTARQPILNMNVQLYKVEANWLYLTAMLSNDSSMNLDSRTLIQSKLIRVTIDFLLHYSADNLR